MFTAAALVARELNQPLPVVKALPLAELWVWAKAAAALSGGRFE